MRVKSVVSIVLVTLILYYAHRLLQLQYYRRCKADLIRVILFNQSTMCTYIANVLQLVEVAYNQVVRHLAAHVLGVLGAGGAIGNVADGFLNQFLRAFE